MPTYEYECKECKYVFEVSGDYKTLIGFRPPCPKCKSEKTRKNFFSFSVIYKGKGFYKTEYEKTETD